MRIISGAFKGRRLKSPSKTSKVRPTTDRVRETLFNLLANRIDLNGAKILDLFCGTGSFGIECLSRGASRAVFVDIDTRTIKENLELVKAGNSVNVIKSDAVRFLNRNGKKFDIVFADPPYSFKDYESLIVQCSQITTLMILEHSSEKNFENIKINLRKDFGETALTFFEFEN